MAMLEFRCDIIIFSNISPKLALSPQLIDVSGCSGSCFWRLLKRPGCGLRSAKYYSAASIVPSCRLTLFIQTSTWKCYNRICCCLRSRTTLMFNTALCFLETTRCNKPLIHNNTKSRSHQATYKESNLLLQTD